MSTDEHEFETDRAEYDAVDHARGGFSFGATLTGVLVALGALSLLTALVGGIAVATGLADEIGTADTATVGWGLGIGLVVVQFISYLWGGYTAGRMARGAGLLHGFMVPLAALLIAGAVIGIVAGLGARADVALGLRTVRLPVTEDIVVQAGIALAVATLAAMFLGGILGGTLGARWHDRLEAHEGEVHEFRAA